MVNLSLFKIYIQSFRQFCVPLSPLLQSLCFKKTTNFLKTLRYARHTLVLCAALIHKYVHCVLASGIREGRLSFTESCSHEFGLKGRLLKSVQLSCVNIGNLTFFGVLLEMMFRLR